MNIAEFGEQVLAHALRNREARKAVQLDKRWIQGTWVGVCRWTGEHIIILDGGGAAIRVRSIRRMVQEKRWDKDRIDAIIARPRTPNPRRGAQETTEPQSRTAGIDLGGGGKTNL